MHRLYSVECNGQVTVYGKYLKNLKNAVVTYLKIFSRYLPEEHPETKDKISQDCRQLSNTRTQF
jgi:hypothetical protein